MNWRFDEHMRSISKCNTSTSFDIYGGIPLKGIWVFVRARMFEILNVSVGDASAKLTLTKNQLHQGLLQVVSSQDKCILRSLHKAKYNHPIRPILTNSVYSAF